jgi:hypothetical protein
MSIAASLEVFFTAVPTIELVVNVICITLVFFAPKRGNRFARRLRYFVTTYILLMLIGGLVYAAFNYLKRYSNALMAEDAVNRKLLMLAVIILISVGCVKIFVSMLKDAKCENNVKLQIYINGREITLDCFVDTGNFLKDPIDMTPVMLLKESAAKELFPEGIPKDIDDPIASKYGNVRIIPVKQGEECEIHLGFRPKRSIIISDKGERETDLCFIIDNERGSYGGYDGLVPASLIE